MAEHAHLFQTDLAIHVVLASTLDTHGAVNFADGEKHLGACILLAVGIRQDVIILSRIQAVCAKEPILMSTQNYNL